MEKVFIMSIIDAGSVREVLDSLKEIPNVKEVHKVYGIFDLIIYIETKTPQEFRDLYNRIKSINKIRSTLPMICMHVI